MSVIAERINVCKICLEKDFNSNLISPCLCKGSIKYIHPHCLADWRKIIIAADGQADQCQLCKQPLTIKQRRVWAALLHYKRSIMKTCIHFALLLTTHPGGITQSWHSLLHLFIQSIQSSIFASLSSTDYSFFAGTFRVHYSPFPVCLRSINDTHSLFTSQWLYYTLFPFSDDRLWQLILCKLEHFHLGFFLLGSINNIWFTYKILNDMFDIVLFGQDHDHEQITTQGNRLSKALKVILLAYCCSLVVLFWIHFNIFAFHVDSNYNSKQFVAELPLWTLRWVTLGVAVADFATRGIYRRLGQLTKSVDEEDVLSLPEES
ncbi:hypothetical protein K501DRAFT_203770 [Backusella circina FSU 941]|nr:hypothetical protein K501DRAFT_203770 [Backusella circina FSU 941]